MSNPLRYHGMLLVAAKHSLSETAGILAEVMGGLDFREDTSGSFEEVPTYIAKRGTFKVLLHGVSPDDESNRFFTLSVQSRDAISRESLEQESSAFLKRFLEADEGGKAGFSNVSVLLKNLIDSDGRLESELPHSA